MTIGIGVKINSVYFTQINPNLISQSTIIKICSTSIIALRTKIKNGYNAIVLESKDLDICKQIKSEVHHSEYIKEFKVNNILNYKLGQIFDIEMFTTKIPLTIQAKTIGKGFSGNIKRNNFQRGPMTHGSKNHRQPGSIGQSTTPGRVFKSKKMAGHLGFSTKTIKNLQILEIDKSNSLLYIKGSIPGKNKNLVYIK
jgi:large subunit ribosomal protein L3